MEEKAITDLKEAIRKNGDWDLALWKAICVYANHPFQTIQTKADFTYVVSTSVGKSGRHYCGECVEGYGNEIWIVNSDGEKKEKGISRSTVNMAFYNALEEQREKGYVSGPRKLGVPWARSVLYPVFLHFGVITSTRPVRHRPISSPVIKEQMQNNTPSENK